jgi:hypothetical protein
VTVRVGVLTTLVGEAGVVEVAVVAGGAVDFAGETAVFGTFTSALASAPVESECCCVS